MAIRTLPGRRPAAGPHKVGWRRLFCFPHAGAGAAAFSQWPQHLPSDVNVCVSCLPGRDGRVDEPPASAMLPLVTNLAQEMLPLLSAPYALFGHSMGAFIAFDLAHGLTALGHPPAHLFVSAQRGPKLPYPGQPIYALPEDEFLAGVLQRYANIPQQVLEQKDLMAIVLRTLRADFTLTEAYRYRAANPLTCPITAFGGSEDRHISREQLESWASETTNRFRLHLLPGSHFFPQESREELLALIRANLNA
jgi:medium-chain acyl-[acyl-carrier-protein] hydrolase